MSPLGPPGKSTLGSDQPHWLQANPTQAVELELQLPPTTSNTTKSPTAKLGRRRCQPADPPVCVSASIQLDPRFLILGTQYYALNVTKSMDCYAELRRAQP